MPRIYKRVARKTRFRLGLRIPTNNKQGFVTNYYEPRDENDEVVCEAGQSYYTWHPKGRSWQFSKTEPKLTPIKSEWNEKFDEFQNRVYEIQELCEGEGDVDELRVEIEEYVDELQSRLDNMPQQLQESSVLNERIEMLQELINDL